jgi:hypothetical protein
MQRLDELTSGTEMVSVLDGVADLLAMRQLGRLLSS